MKAGTILIASGVAAAAGVASWGQVSDQEMAELQGKLPPPFSGNVNFDSQVLPIFESRCFRCHGEEKPKASFSLSTRERALQGGDNGPAIHPGKSDLSPLIYYVSQLVEDYEMPPSGKGEPLTSEEVAVLRAWIDQGAAWSEAALRTAARFRYSASPTLLAFKVDGDERKFREHTGFKEGVDGGLQMLEMEQDLGSGRKVLLQARILVNPEDYRLRLVVDQRELGFIEVGFEQYREYYDDTGGHYSLFEASAFSLGRDLHLDIGRVWMDAGIRKPNWPELTFGYEYRYRTGTKSTLQWGDVGPGAQEDASARKIYPNAKEIDEDAHLFKFDLVHEVAGVGIENQFRAELYDLDTQRQNPDFLNPGGGGRPLIPVREDHDHFQASDSIRLEKQLRDWLYLSGGYFFSRMDAEAGITVEETQSNTPKYWRGDRIVLEQNHHVFNANSQWGPWSGLTLFNGMQSEWMNQRGMGPLRLDRTEPADPALLDVYPHYADADIDRVVTREYAGARYTSIPYTVLHVEGTLSQEELGQSEMLRDDGRYGFLRDTDAETDSAEIKSGVTVSPWTRLSLTAQHRYKKRESDFDHWRDQNLSSGAKPGYPAFITWRETEMQEWSLKASVRPASWLKTTLAYRRIHSDFGVATAPYIIPPRTIVIPQDPDPPLIITRPAQVISEGGALTSGRHQADVVSASISMTRIPRLFLSSSVSWQRTESKTHHHLNPALTPYEGDIYSTISSATYNLNAKSDLILSWHYSWADFGQKNAAEGLPVGLVYDWHGLSAGITRAFRKNVTGSIQYRFYSYDERNTGGENDYTAHGVVATLAMVLD